VKAEVAERQRRGWMERGEDVCEKKSERREREEEERKR